MSLQVRVLQKIAVVDQGPRVIDVGAILRDVLSRMSSACAKLFDFTGSSSDSFLYRAVDQEVRAKLVASVPAEAEVDGFFTFGLSIAAIGSILAYFMGSKQAPVKPLFFDHRKFIANPLYPYSDLGQEAFAFASQKLQSQRNSKQDHFEEDCIFSLLENVHHKLKMNCQIQINTKMKDRNSRAVIEAWDALLKVSFVISNLKLEEQGNLYQKKEIYSYPQDYQKVCAFYPKEQFGEEGTPQLRWKQLFFEFCSRIEKYHPGTDPDKLSFMIFNIESNSISFELSSLHDLKHTNAV